MTEIMREECRAWSLSAGREAVWPEFTAILQLNMKALATGGARAVDDQGRHAHHAMPAVLNTSCDPTGVSMVRSMIGRAHAMPVALTTYCAPIVAWSLARKPSSSS